MTKTEEIKNREEVRKDFLNIAKKVFPDLRVKDVKPFYKSNEVSIEELKTFTKELKLHYVFYMK